MTHMQEGREFGILMNLQGAGMFLLGKGRVRMLREPDNGSGQAVAAASNVPAALRALADYIETGLVVDEESITLHFGPEGER